MDSEAAAHCARARTLPNWIVSDNPLLAADSNGQIINIDALVTQQEALRLGTLALKIANQIDQRLTAPKIVAQYRFLVDCLYTAGAMSRTIASLLHRGAALARALQVYRPERVSMFLLDLPPHEPADPFTAPRFSHPARPLSERGFFGSLPNSFEPVPTALPTRLNDTTTRDFVRRVALFAPAVIVNEMFRRIMQVSDAPILVAEENEAIRETLSWLRRRGVAARTCGPLLANLRVPTDGTPVRRVTIEPSIVSNVGPDIRREITRSGIFLPQQTEAIVALVLEHVTAGMEHLSRQIRAVDERLAQWFGSAGGILLTNGLYGPVGAQAFGLCRRHGVHIGEFEHGVTAGISALTDFKIAEGNMPTGDLLLVCSENSVRAFSAGGHYRRVVAIGLPDCVRRIRHRALQRHKARRALNLKREQFCIMHVSTLLYSGNLRPGLGTPTESTTYEIDRTLIQDVYAGLPHQVIFKQYPTQRFPYEPSYDHIFKLAPNVRVTKDEDFRYIRAAADVIVTMTPTSTLGWCVGAGKPLVWLDSKIVNPLSRSDLRDVFRQAFIFVDIDQSDWPLRLRELLNCAPEIIEREWKARRQVREKLLREVIIGPESSLGGRAGELVLQILREQKRSLERSIERQVNA